MKLIKNVRSVLSGVYLSLKRFPLTIMFSVSVAAVLIVISEINSSDDTLNKLAMILALGIPISLCIKLFFERKQLESTYKLNIIYLVGILFLIFYYFIYLDNIDMVSTTRYIAVNLALYLCFLFIPYLPQKEEFELYVITILKGLFITFIYSVVLYIGLSSILFTIDKLLGIQIPSKIYYYAGLFVVFVFALSYFLSLVPAKGEILVSKSYPKPLKILLLYIIMPLLTAYTIILYIYFLKILFTAKWPIGLVSHLVLWYSIIATTVLFFITPIKDENLWQNKFLKFFPKIILPLLIMMFISMGIRINAYGVTEKRYFVIILGLFIFSIMLYFSFIKKQKNIIIPVLLSIITVISVFGPISSFSISKYSQNSRFERVLLKNNMLKDNKITNSTKISDEDKATLSSIIDYFRRDHSLKDVKYLPENFILEDMNDVFGFPFTESNYNSASGYFNYTRNISEAAYEINGYDFMLDSRTINSSNNASTSGIKASFDYGNSTIKLNYKGKEIYEKNLKTFVKQLNDKHKVSMNTINLSPEEMNLVDENDKVKVKFLFLNISGNNNLSNENPESIGIEFYVLVKFK